MKDESLDPSCGSTLGLTGFNFCNKTGLDNQYIILCCANMRAIIKDSVRKGVSLAFIAKAYF
jgi:hypothetical protein